MKCANGSPLSWTKTGTIGDLTIGTFHSICLSLLRETGKAVTLLSQEDAQAVAADVLGQAEAKLPPAKLVQAVSRKKTDCPVPENVNAAFCESYVAAAASWMCWILMTCSGNAGAF